MVTFGLLLRFLLLVAYVLLESIYVNLSLFSIDAILICLDMAFKAHPRTVRLPEYTGHKLPSGAVWSINIGVPMYAQTASSFV